MPPRSRPDGIPVHRKLGHQKRRTPSLNTASASTRSLYEAIAARFSFDHFPMLVQLPTCNAAAVAHV